MEAGGAHRPEFAGGYRLVDVVVNDDTGKAELLEAHFKKWRKEQSVQFLTVEVPKDKAEAVIEAIKANGGKVIK